MTVEVGQGCPTYGFLATAVMTHLQNFGQRFTDRFFAVSDVTGRFDGATGHASVTGNINVVTFEYDGQLRGQCSRQKRRR